MVFKSDIFMFPHNTMTLPACQVSSQGMNMGSFKTILDLKEDAECMCNVVAAKAVFHVACIHKWGDTGKTSCPVCRYDAAILLKFFVHRGAPV